MRVSLVTALSAAVIMLAVSIMFLGRPGGSAGKPKTGQGIDVVGATHASALHFPAAGRVAGERRRPPDPQSPNAANVAAEALAGISHDIVVEGASCSANRCVLKGSVSSPDNWESGDAVLKEMSGEYLQRQLVARGIDRESIEMEPLGDGIVIFNMTLKGQ